MSTLKTNSLVQRFFLNAGEASHAVVEGQQVKKKRISCILMSFLIGSGMSETTGGAASTVGGLSVLVAVEGRGREDSLFGRGAVSANPQ